MGNSLEETVILCLLIDIILKFKLFAVNFRTSFIHTYMYTYTHIDIYDKMHMCVGGWGERNREFVL